MSHQEQISLAPAYLLKLAMSFDASSSLSVNYKRFLKAIVSKNYFKLASIWSLEDAELLASSSTFRTNKNTKTAWKNIVGKLKKSKVFTSASKEKTFSKIVQEQGIKSGSFIIIGINSTTFLKLYSDQDLSSFNKSHVKKLVEISNRFGKNMLNYQQQKDANKKDRAMLATLYDYTNDKICAVDTSYRLLHQNRSFKTIAPFFNKKSFKIKDVILPSGKARPVFKKGLDLAFKGKQTQIVRHYKLKGIDRIDNVSFIPLKKDGKVIGATIHGREMTAYVNAKAALSEIEQENRAAYRLAKIGKWEFDLIQNKISWSQETYDILGIKPKKNGPTYKQYINLIHPEDQTTLIKNFELTISKQKRYDLEIRKKVNGKWIYTRCIGNPVIENKKVVRVLGTIQDINDMKQAELEIAKVSQQYQDLFENMHDALIVTDKTGQFTDVNKAATKLIGWSKQEILNKSIADIVHPDDIAKSKATLKKLKNVGFYSNYEGRIIDRAGNFKTIQVNSNAIYDENGNFNGSRDIARDITKQRKDQIEIENLARFPNEIPNPVIRVGRDGIIHFVNAMGKKLLEIWGITIGDIIPPYMLDMVQRSFTENKTEIFNVEYFDNTYSLLLTPFKNNDFLYIYGRDITDLVQAEMKFLDSENRMGLIIENALDALLTIDSKGKIMEWNKRAVTMFGYAKEEVIGRNYVKMLIPKRSWGLHESTRQRYIETGSLIVPPRIEFYTLHRDGTEIPVEVGIIPFKTRENQYFSGIVRDISIRQKQEQKRAKLMQELESVNKELSDFAYVVSHDLKAPLRAIGSLTHWLKEDYFDKFDETGKENLSLLNSRVKRMHHFIDAILQYSRIGRSEMAIEEVDLNNLIKQVIENIDPPKKFTIDIPKKLPKVYCEKIRMEQVFQNLIGNAIKYNDKKKGKVKITFKKKTGFYQFEIKDNGKGIEAKYFDKIFQIFQTLQARDRYESTGIGLSIVKRIVELHGGEIKVKSKPGKSTTFTFNIKDYN